MDDEQYHEGFYSVFDADHILDFNQFASGRSIIEQHLTHWPIAQLDWFTQGMISASTQDDRLIINDLRMGVESSYVFRFDVGALVTAQKFEPEITQLLPLKLNPERMRAIVRRVWDESTPIPTPAIDKN